MNIASLSGNDAVIGLLKEFGINAGIVVAAVLMVFVGGRATGLIDVVGYQWKSAANYGLLGDRREPISVATPAFLKKGDRLIASYDATIEAGRVSLYVRKGLVPAAFMRKTQERHYVEQSGTGTYEFIVQEDGVYWPASRISSGNQSSECKKNRRGKSLLQNLVVPDLNCPTKSARFSVWWRVG